MTLYQVRIKISDIFLKKIYFYHFFKLGRCSTSISNKMPSCYNTQSQHVVLLFIEADSAWNVRWKNTKKRINIQRVYKNIISVEVFLQNVGCARQTIDDFLCCSMLVAFHTRFRSGLLSFRIPRPSFLIRQIPSTLDADWSIIIRHLSAV